MLKARIINASYERELEEKANKVFAEIQNSGYKIIDTDVAGRASETGNEWIMTIVYDDDPLK